MGMTNWGGGGGGRKINLSRALDFKAYLDECNFLDLGFLGP